MDRVTAFNIIPLLLLSHAPPPTTTTAAATTTTTTTWVAPKLMPPILLCRPRTSEADVGDMAAEVEPSPQYSVKFCCRTTDDSRGAV